jgi:hypothetical protein
MTAVTEFLRLDTIMQTSPCPAAYNRSIIACIFNARKGLVLTKLEQTQVWVRIQDILHYQDYGMYSSHALYHCEALCIVPLLLRHRLNNLPNFTEAVVPSQGITEDTNLRSDVWIPLHTNLICLNITELSHLDTLC